MFQNTPLKRVLFPHALTSVMVGGFLAALVLFSFLLAIFGTSTAEAATNTTINFQARLQNAAGNIAPDGNYNVQFKLYNVSSGGTALWTETYQNSNSQGVTVKNGYLTANLGSITAFPGTINWDQDLWVTLNIGGTSTVASPTYDGEMNPRLHLTSVPYAFRAGQLAQFNSGNGFTSTLNLIQPTSGNQVFQVPDQGATGTYNLCIANSSACGFALSSGNTNYIQNQIGSAQTSSNFWISGTGRAATALQAPLIDAATASTALNIGTTNASVINLNQNVVVANDKTFTAGGNALFKAATASQTAFLITSSSGTPLFNVDSTTANLVTNSSFELNISNWNSQGTATLSQTSSQSFSGLSSLQAVVTAASSGVQTSAFTTPILANTQYEVTFMARCSTSLTTFTYGLQNNGVDYDVTTAASCNTNWQRYSYHITTTATISSPGIYMTLGSTTSGSLFVDAVQVLQTNTSGAQPYAPGSIRIDGVISDPVAIRNASNSTNAFEVQDTTGMSNTLVVDTANDIVNLSALNIGGTPVISAGRALQNVSADTAILTTGTLGVARGGTGVNGSTAANGQLLIGNGSGFALGTLTAGSGISINNTAGAISISATANGTAGGDLTGTYPNPTIAKLQGSTLTLNTPASGNLLQFNGTAWVNQSVSGDITISSTGVAGIGTGKVTSAMILDGTVSGTDIANNTVTNTNLQSGTFTNITGTGALAAGSITSGFGTINTSNTITGTTLNGTTGISTGAGAGTQRIDASGNLTNIGTISGTGAIQLSGTSGSSYIMNSLGLGTTNPQAGGALTIANGSWISSVDSSGSSYINMFQVNSNNQIQVGAALNVDGGIVLPTNGGQMTFSDLPIDSTATAGTQESYTLRVGSTNALTVYGEADGAGNAQNVRVAVGSSIAPGYTLDVGGDVNISSGSVYRINGIQICSSGGCTASSTSAIQNQNTSAQTTANFWISGAGRADGGFVGPSLDAASGTLSIGASTASTITIATNAVAHTIAIGNGAAAQGITIGSTNGASSLLLQAGTGNISLSGAAFTAYTIGATNTTGTLTVGQSTASNSINIGNNTIAAGNTGTINIGTSSTSTGKTAITIGSTNGSSTLQLQGGSSVTLTGAAATNYLIGSTTGTGTITVGQSTATNSINVGNAAVTGTQTINIATGATGASGKAVVTIGSTNDGSSLTLQAGTGGVAVTASNVSLSVNNGGAILNSTSSSATAFVVQSASTTFLTADASKQSVTTKDLFVGSPANVALGMRLLTDGFETGGYGGYEAWGSYSSGASMDATTVHSGKYALKLTASASAEYVNSAITPNTTVYGRTYFNVSSLGNPTYLEQFGENSIANWLDIYLGASGDLCYTSNLSGSTVSACSATAPSTGAWHKLETAVTTGSSTGVLQVYLDGVLVTSNANAINLTAQNFGTAQIDSFALGANVASTATVDYDDVAVDVGATGDSSSAYVSDTLHIAGSTSSGTLILSNTDSTGNSIEAAGGINAGGSFSSQGQDGVSSSCTNGQSLTNVQVTGGIITGGKCANAVSTLQDAYNNTSVQSGGTASTPAFTGNQATGTGGNTASDTVSIAATTAGDLLVAVVGTGAASPGQHVASITGGGTWKHAVSGVGGGPYSNMEIWYCYNCGSTTSVSITFDVKGNSTVNISEYSGVLKSADPLEIASGGSGGGPYTQTTPSITTINNNDLLVAGMSISSGNVTGASTPTSFTALTNTLVGNKHSFADYDASVAAGSYSATWTLTGGTGNSGVGIVAFKPDVSGSSTTVASILLADAKDYIITAPDTTTDPNVIVNLQCRTGCSTAQGRWAIQSNGVDALSVLYDPSVSITNVRIQSGVDIKMAADAVGAPTGQSALTHDFVCTSSESVHDLVGLTTAGAAQSDSTNIDGGIFGVIVAKPSSTVCTVAFSGIVQVNGGGNTIVIGDAVQATGTAGVAQASTRSPSNQNSIGIAISAKDGNNLFWALLH